VFSSALRQDNDCPQSLAPQAVCPITITYTPQVQSPQTQFGPFYAEISPDKVVTSTIEGVVFPLSVILSVGQGSEGYGATYVVLSGHSSLQMPPDPTAVASFVPITITLNGASASTTTDRYGNFSIVMNTPPLTAPSYTGTVSSAATTKYQASSSTFSVVVAPAASAIIEGENERQRVRNP
jgi:hypothetical protein